MITLTNIILAAAAVLLAISAFIGINRIAAGPSQLDRSVAADLIVAIVVASLGLWVIWRGRSTELMVLVLLSLLGFTSAVSVARMVADRINLRSRYNKRRKERIT